MKNAIALLILAVYGASFFYLGVEYTKRNEKILTIERVVYRDKPTPVFLSLPKKAKIQNEVNVLSAAIDAKHLGLKR